jgi:hypothetical protein
MTKETMDKFFSIKLRDYVKNNTINSLVIWYAGHGKYVVQPVIGFHPTENRMMSLAISVLII